MNEHRLDAALRAIGASHVRHTAPPILRERAMAVPSAASEHRGFMPPISGRLQSMLSATKFVVAGVIVALFGGFLLAGVLTQRPSDESLPGVQASASRSPRSPSTPSAERGMTIIDDLIPGASLVTWEVEPGVYQVLHDGVRSLDGHGFSSDSSVLAPHGEPIRVFEPDHFYSVGVDFTGTPPAEGFGGRQTDFEVGPDGLLHAGDPSGLYWLRGERWIEDPDFGDRHVRAIEVGSDGAIWVLWCRGGLRNNECIGQRLHRSGADGWERIDLPDDPDLALFLRAENRMALDAEGGLWLAIEGAGLLHQDGNGWSVVDPVGRATHDFGGWSDGQVDVGGDGSLWAYFLGPEDSGEAYLVRLIGEEWTVYDQEDGVPVGLDTEMGAPGILRAGDDGSVWLVNGEGGGEGSGVWHFDGSTSRAFLHGFAIGSLELAADGMVWLRGSSWQPGTEMGRPTSHTYVITREAVAATE